MKKPKTVYKQVNFKLNPNLVALARRKLKREGKTLTAIFVNFLKEWAREK